MIFWILAACLTAAVAAVLLVPLARPARAVAGGGHDVEVYRDQLAELDRDVESGNVAESEAEIARAEIGRRLLKAAGDDGAGNKRSSASLGRLASIAVVVLVPVLGLGTYLALGYPGLPGAPLAAREAGPNGDPELARMIGKAEDHLRENPNDGRGWDVLAPIYLRTGRVRDAEAAYENAIRLLGSTARRQSGLGETLVAASGGAVTDEARAAFEKAAKLEPGDPKASFFLALGLAQDGKKDEALKAFQAMEKEASADAPWLPAVQQQIAALGGTPQAGGTAKSGAGAPPGNPTAEDMAAAQDMSAGDRIAMIRGMVGRLDARLRDDPRNLEGWMRLVRSYMVLNEPDKAKDALSRALAVFPAGSEDGKALVTLAQGLGIPAKEETE